MNRPPLLAILSAAGSSVILLALSALLLIWLAMRGSRRIALSWAAILVLCVGTLAALKLYFGACPMPEHGLSSPSGHAGFSLFVYGSALLCSTRDETRWRLWLVIPSGIAWILAIAWSRHAMHAHSASEILLGSLIGLLALGLMALQYRRFPRADFPYLPALAAALTLIAIFVALHAEFTIEPMLNRWAGLLPKSVCLAL